MLINYRQNNDTLSFDFPEPTTMMRRAPIRSCNSVPPCTASPVPLAHCASRWSAAARYSRSGNEKDVRDRFSRRRLLGAFVAASLVGVRSAFAVPAPGRFRIVVRNPATEKFNRESEDQANLALGVSAALAEFGYEEGRNLVTLGQFAALSADEGEAQLAEIRKGRVDAIVVLSHTALDWQKRFPEVPIVAWGVQDPVQQGLARSFARPGGNITGTTQGMEEVARKSVELLRRLVPGLSGIALFCWSANANPGSPRELINRLERGFFETAIREAGLRLEVIGDSHEVALAAFPTLRARGLQAMMYETNPFDREGARRHVDAARRARSAP
jgi:hypothetical protein